MKGFEGEGLRGRPRPGREGKGKEELVGESTMRGRGRKGKEIRRGMKEKGWGEDLACFRFRIIFFVTPAVLCLCMLIRLFSREDSA